MMTELDKILAHRRSSLKYYRANKGKCATATQKSNRALKIEVFQHYSGGSPSCAVCGKRDILVLCLDHISGNGEEHRRNLNVIGGIVFYRKLKEQGYPSGIQVLCANCNLRKEMLKFRR